MLTPDRPSPAQATIGTRTERPQRSFKVPFARDPTGHEVRADEAQRPPYECVDCRTRVVLRRAHVREGGAVRAHFAHRANADCNFSQGEGELHLRAKYKIRYWVESRRAITLRRRCPRCLRPHDQLIPETVASASLEHRLPSGRRADVALLDANGGLLAVIEICGTHAVDEAKACDLKVLRWCEVSASAVLSGDCWELLQDQLNPFTCRPCRDTALRPWTGPHRSEVQCPLPGASAVVAVVACAGCPHFLDAAESGVTCWGSS